MMMVILTHHVQGAFRDKRTLGVDIDGLPCDAIGSLWDLDVDAELDGELGLPDAGSPAELGHL
jgi:hypothetical protein